MTENELTRMTEGDCPLCCKAATELAQLRERVSEAESETKTFKANLIHYLRTFAEEGAEPDASDYRDARTTLGALTRAGKDHT